MWEYFSFQHKSKHLLIYLPAFIFWEQTFVVDRCDEDGFFPPPAEDASALLKAIFGHNLCIQAFKERSLRLKETQRSKSLWRLLRLKHLAMLSDTSIVAGFFVFYCQGAFRLYIWHWQFSLVHLALAIMEGATVCGTSISWLSPILCPLCWYNHTRQFGIYQAFCTFFTLVKFLRYMYFILEYGIPLRERVPKKKLAKFVHWTNLPQTTLLNYFRTNTTNVRIKEMQ